MVSKVLVTSVKSTIFTYCPKPLHISQKSSLTKTVKMKLKLCKTDHLVLHLNKLNDNKFNVAAYFSKKE